MNKALLLANSRVTNSCQKGIKVNDLTFNILHKTLRWLQQISAQNLALVLILRLIYYKTSKYILVFKFITTKAMHSNKVFLGLLTITINTIIFPFWELELQKVRYTSNGRLNKAYALVWKHPLDQMHILNDSMMQKHSIISSQSTVNLTQLPHFVKDLMH